MKENKLYIATPITEEQKKFIGEKFIYDDDGAFIWGIALDGALQKIADLRGFGAISRRLKYDDNKAQKFQDSIGEWIVSVLNNALEQPLHSSITAEEYLKEINWWTEDSSSIWVNPSLLAQAMINFSQLQTTAPSFPSDEEVTQFEIWKYNNDFVIHSVLGDIKWVSHTTNVICSTADLWKSFRMSYKEQTKNKGGKE